MAPQHRLGADAKLGLLQCVPALTNYLQPMKQAGQVQACTVNRSAPQGYLASPVVRNSLLDVFGVNAYPFVIPGHLRHVHPFHTCRYLRVTAAPL